MARTYTTTLYYNTGYNRGNVPDSPALLAGIKTKQVDPVIKWQSVGLATIEIRAEWEDVRNVDYVSLQNGTDIAYYIVDGPATMLNEYTAQLRLVLDPLTTAGGLDGIEVLGGWEDRAHVSSDGMFSNILPEPVSPKAPLHMDAPVALHESSQAELKSFVASTVNLDKIEDVADVYSGATTTGSEVIVCVPSLPVVGNMDTKIQMETSPNSAANARSYNISYTGIYDMSIEGMPEAIQRIKSLGIEGAILASYSIPADDVAVYHREDGGGLLTIILGQCKEYSLDTMPYKYKSGIKNNKVYSMFNVYHVRSICSGDSVDIDAHELYAGGASPDFRLLVDPSPSGACYLQPTYYEGQATKLFQLAVKGAKWINAALAMYGGSGALISQARTARANITSQEQLEYTRKGYVAGQAQNAVNGVIGAASGIWGGIVNLKNPKKKAEGISQIIGGVQTAINTGFDAYNNYNQWQSQQLAANAAIGDNLFSSDTAANIAAPDISYPIDDVIQAYNGNAFLVYRTRLSDADAETIDKFFTMFGYAQNKKFEKSDLSSRTKYNYIKTHGAQCKASTLDMSSKGLLEQMFDNGIRIWHVAPSSAAYDDNPIKGV